MAWALPDENRSMRGQVPSFDFRRGPGRAPTCGIGIIRWLWTVNGKPIVRTGFFEERSMASRHEPVN